MSSKINTDSPIIGKGNILEISLTDLGDFYVATQHSYKQYDLFFRTPLIYVCQIKKRRFSPKVCI